MVLPTTSVHSKTVVLALLLAVVGVFINGFAHGATVSQLLDKSAQAANSVSYKGTLMYSHGTHTETLRVYHRASPMGFKERIQSLNGKASEIVRTEKGVWCFFPEKREGYFKFQGDGFYRTPKISAASFGQLSRYYSIMVDGQERIADRMAHRLVFSPKDQFRHGLKLWIDDRSVLLLRSDLLTQEMTDIDSDMLFEI